MTKWKTCAEDLPSLDHGTFYSKTVLLYGNNTISTGYFYYQNHLFDDDGNLDLDNEDIIKNGFGAWEWDIGCYDFKPIYWMELPEPSGEEKEGKYL